MPFEFLNRADNRPRGRTRTLIVKDGAVWMWPGIPLALEVGGTFRLVSDGWTERWARAFHGFSAPLEHLHSAIGEACQHLERRDEPAALKALDDIDLGFLSPDGDALLRTAAAEFGIEPLDLPVTASGLPWRSINQPRQAQLLRCFSEAAAALEKAWDPEKHPKWSPGTPNSLGGKFRPIENDQSPSGDENSAAIGIGHSDPPPDEPPEIPDEPPPTKKLINRLIKGLAQWALRRSVGAAIPFAGEVLFALDAASWIRDYLPFVEAYLDKPRSLDELTSAANA